MSGQSKYLYELHNESSSPASSPTSGKRKKRRKSKTSTVQPPTEARRAPLNHYDSVEMGSGTSSNPHEAAASCSTSTTSKGTATSLDNSDLEVLVERFTLLTYREQQLLISHLKTLAVKDPRRLEKLQTVLRSDSDEDSSPAKGSLAPKADGLVLDFDDADYCKLAEILKTVEENERRAEAERHRRLLEGIREPVANDEVDWPRVTAAVGKYAQTLMRYIELKAAHEAKAEAPPSAVSPKGKRKKKKSVKFADQPRDAWDSDANGH